MPQKYSAINDFHVHMIFIHDKSLLIEINFPYLIYQPYEGKCNISLIISIWFILFFSESKQTI